LHEAYPFGIFLVGLKPILIEACWQLKPVFIQVANAKGDVGVAEQEKSKTRAV